MELTLEVFADVNMQVFRERLLVARKRAGLTQAAVSALADIYPTYYSEIEQGKQQGLRMNTLYKLCMVLNVSADYLLNLPPAPGGRWDA